MRVFAFYSQSVGLASEILPAGFFNSSFFQGFPAVPRVACVRVPATSDQSAWSPSRLHLALEMALSFPLNLAKNRQDQGKVLASSTKLQAPKLRVKCLKFG